MTCRCAVLNNLTGDAAAEYARRHLDVTRETPGRTIQYRCAETGIDWIEETAPNAYDHTVRRLRRLGR